MGGGPGNASTAAPLISVVLPVYNGAATVAEAVVSILDQTFGDFELLVLDDGSIDDTLAIARALAARDQRVRVCAEPHRGLVGTLNRGIEIARGALIARMDADDVSLPERFARQVAYLDAHPDCVAVGTEIIKVDPLDRPHKGRAPRVPRRPAPAAAPTAFPPRPHGLAHPTAMIRRAALKAIGGYRTCFEGAEDRDLWWRLAEQGRLHTIAELLLRYRVHPASSSRAKRGMSVLGSILADLSAIARHHRLDDSAIVASAGRTLSLPGAIAAYEALIGDRYPVATFHRYYLIRQRAWRLAGFADRQEMLADIIRHVAQRPLDPARLRLLGVAATRGLARQREVALPPLAC